MPQPSSPEFDAAVSQSVVVWVPPKLESDWGVDGYGGTGTIDDMPLGEEYNVRHSLDDGMPDAVSSSLASDPTGSMSAELTGASGMDGRQYFSQYNTSSPVSGFDRDLAPTRLEQGLITANGQEYIRIFTGQMANVVISGRRAAMDAISATRLAMARSVHPPVINGPIEGANATWLVSWILDQCDINLSPPPRSGCRLWIPFHGSLHPFLPHGHRITVYRYWRWTAVSVSKPERPKFVTGPFVLGALAEVTATTGRRIHLQTLQLTPGEELLSQSASRGRVEFWVRGDSSPGGGNTPAGLLPVFLFFVDSTGSAQISAELDGNRNLRIQIHDGTSLKVFNSGLTLPTDSAWHAIGLAWNVSTNKVWAYLDGTEVNSTSLGLSATNLPDEDEFESWSPELFSWLPVSDFQFTTGAESDPDAYSWLDEGSQEPGAVIAYEDFEDASLSLTITGTWYRANVTGPDAGNWSYRSGTIPHNGTTDAVVTVPPGAQTVTFWYRVSSESSYDFFRFFVGASQKISISGEQPWRRSATYDVSAAANITFRYIKDGSVIEGSDSAFVDNIEFRGAPSALVPFEPGAIVRPVDLEFEAIAEPIAREAWAMVHGVAQSTLTAIRTDENDLFNFLPPGYFVEAAQLVEAEPVSTDLNAEDIGLNLDPTKIRNTVQVNYEEFRVDTTSVFVLIVNTATLIPRGTTQHTFAFETPVVWVDESIDVVTTFTSTAVSSVVSFNTVSDGSGSYLSAGLVVPSVVSWDAGSITLQFRNNSAQDVYIVNNGGNEFPFLGIAGFAVHSGSASSTVSDIQEGRAERLLTVSAPAVQRRTDGFTLAASILGLTRIPRPEISVTIIGDPRRQPGDLITLTDTQGTLITGLWRVMSIDHARNGADYTQSLQLRKELPIALWDDDPTGWDEGVWAL